MTEPLVSLGIDRDGDTATIHITGEIDLSNAATLQDAIVGQVEGVPDIVLDLGDVAYLDSQGIRLIYRLAKRFSTRGAQFTVVAPTDSVAGQLIRLTQLQDLVTVLEAS